MNKADYFSMSLSNFVLGVPPTVKSMESQSSPPKKTFTASSGANPSHCIKAYTDKCLAL